MLCFAWERGLLFMIRDAKAAEVSVGVDQSTSLLRFDWLRIHDAR